jgi:hypothetical protein
MERKDLLKQKLKAKLQKSSGQRLSSGTFAIDQVKALIE